MLAKRFDAEAGKIAKSEIVLAELRFGAEKHQSRTQEIHESINDFVLRLDVVPGRTTRFLIVCDRTSNRTLD